MAAAAIRVVGLRCEYRVNPAGIGGGRPRLSWKLEAVDPAGRGLGQSGYQVQVGTLPGLGDVWDSGKVESGRTNQVEYGGRGLVSGQVCWWRVRAWDQDGGESEWSEAARWSVGLLRASDWVGKWIGYDGDWENAKEPEAAAGVELDGAKWIGTGEGAVGATIFSEPAKSVVYFRKVFEVPAGKKVSRAGLMMGAEDGFEVYVNGVSRGGMTAWGKAKGVDVTPFLREGRNLIAVAVRKYREAGVAGVVGRVRVEFEGGGELVVETDESWVWSRESLGWEKQGVEERSGAGEAGECPGNAHGREAGVMSGVSGAGWRGAVVLGVAGEGEAMAPRRVELELPPPACLRKAFAVGKEVRRAVAYVSALGVCEVTINGKGITADVLGPAGWTEFSRRVYYRAYDVTQHVVRGENCLGILLGDGWFAGYYSYQGKRNLYGGEPRVLLQVNVTYADGSQEVIGSDGSWRGGYGGWREADLLMGAKYDARRAVAGWDGAGFDDSGWGRAAVEEAALAEEAGELVWTIAAGERGLSPSGVEVERAKGAAAPVRRVVFGAHPGNAVRRQGEVVAKSVVEARPGVWVFDLGQNMVGWVRLRVRDERSARIEIHHAEMLNPDGTLYETNLRAARAVDVFVPAGVGEEVFEPVFTFHGFRYVSVTGLTNRPDLDTVTGVVVHTELEQTGTFACSNDRVNGLVHNILWGQKGNHLEIPTDCPQRDERLGWTGDAQFFMRTGAYVMDVSAFFTKWLVDLIDDAQYADGSFGSVAPDQNVGHGNTAWDDAAIVCPWILYRVYGDTRVIERHWGRMARYIDFLQVTSKQFIRGAGAYGDWVNLGGGAKSEVMGTAYSAYVTGLMAKMAAAIGREADGRKYGLLAEAIRAAFIKAFVKEDGSILESSQTGYALAFTMDLLPEAARAGAAEKFVGEVERTGWHLGTGFIGTPRLLPGLTEAGRSDVAYRLLMNETFPSWLYQVKLGATTMWERWDGWTPERGFQDPGMNSFNHYAFGSVGEWLFGTVGGIETMEAGFGKFRIAPRPGGGLSWVNVSYESVHGRITSEWRMEGDRFVLRVGVPVNTRAVVELPDGQRHEVGSGGYAFSCAV